MQNLSLVWGILATGGLVVAFAPCLGWLNWFNIPFAGVGLVLSAVTLANAKDENRGGALTGTICCSLAVVIGLVRLWLGGGVV
ncbi:MAG: hypothetical protein EXR79_17815 [Myxococcales bacterium]|nr:hypothetical protein [Myxococcales bacterium]